MLKRKVCAIATRSVALLVVLGTAHEAVAQNASTRYPKMAPVAQYLMTDQAAEIALARSAAPPSISRNAEVLVLGRHGFETAVKGSNGFVCIVQRGWTAAPDPDFWNPKVRVPMCANAAADRSYLVRVENETAWMLAGQTKAQLDQSIAANVGKKELPPMEAGAMCYMTSKLGYAGDSSPHWAPHVMFFYSKLDPATWGANLPGSPMLAVADPAEQLTAFAVAVQTWSDGARYRPTSAHSH